ncbi:hypothetical protein [Aquimarina longa]|uniref:hypothetical protein n=1 Tax=Aquimarina longa TaxID=1080221 RepID=UPI0007806BF5|nr:hypothetical protein [Aquimarina longa]
MKINFYCFLVLFYSCITTHKVKQIDNFRIETENIFKEETFVFKPNMLPGVARRSLRKQFGLTDDQNISDFNIKLFNEFDLMFNVKISFEVDREESTYLLPYADEETIGDAETFVKISIVDSSGNNCLSTRSLFYAKTVSFLMDIKNTIKKEEYYNTPIIK